MEAIDETAGDAADEIESNAGTPPPKRGRRARARVNGETPREPESTTETPPPTKTMEELEAETILAGSKSLPKPVENVKTLGDLVARYRIGSDPEFKMQLHRSSPKLFSGPQGPIKLDGYYGTYDFPLTDDYIRDEYGGGVYRVVVVGPNPTSPNVPKHYESVSLNFPGDPRFDRVPRAVSDVVHGQQQGAQVPMMPPMMAGDDPKIVQTVMNVLKETITEERTERKEEAARAKSDVQAAAAMQAPVIAVHEKRADDIAKYEAQLRESEVGAVREQLAAERQRSERLEREMQEIRNAMQSAPRESTVEIVKGMAEVMRPLVDRPPAAAPDTGVRDMAENMVKDLTARHAEELRRIEQSHTASLDALRSAHAAEKAAAHQAHLNEMQSERDAARRREERLDEQLKMERDERRKDDDRFRQQTKDRDQNWEDRLSQQREQLNQNWENRLQMTNTSNETRISLLQSEIDRLKGEISEARAKLHDQNDPLAMVHKADELRTALGAPAPGSQPSSSGGIGIKTEEGEWKNILAEGVSDRLPNILDVLGRRFFPELGQQQGGTQQGQGQQQQQPPKVGDLINHPQYGEVYVVQDPRTGQLGLAPRAQYEAWLRSQGRALPPQQQRQSQGSRTSGGGGGAQTSIMGGGDGRRRRGKERSAMPVPDLAYGLDKPTPRDEVPRVVYRDPNAPPQAAAPAPEQRRSRRSPPPPPVVPRPSDGGVIRMSPMERQAITLIAKMVHKSVMDVEEPEEFVARTLQEQPAEMLKAIVTNYSPQQIVDGIRSIQPDSAGATPHGEEFTTAAFTLLRERLLGG